MHLGLLELRQVRQGDGYLLWIVPVVASTGQAMSLGPFPERTL